MRKFTLLISGLLLSVGGYSKSMLEVWKSMPERMVLYVDMKQRQEMADFISMGLKGETDHLLQGKSRVDSLTDNYLHVKLNESAEIQIKRLAYQNGDSILCVVRTWMTPEAESEVLFYTQEWESLNIGTGTGDINFLPLQQYGCVRPDSMSQEEFERLNENTDFILTSARISADSDELTISHVAPLASKEDREKMETVWKTVRLKWTGAGFEE